MFFVMYNKYRKAYFRNIKGGANLFKHLKKKICKNYGYIIVKEVLPIFYDYAKTTNKTVFRLEKSIEKNKAVFISDASSEIKVFSNSDFVTQNGKPIRVYDFIFKKGEFDINFQKEGYKVGDIYQFLGLGYLGNLDCRGVIKLVTDQYVIFDGGKSIFLYSYKELELLHKKYIQ